LRRGLIVKKITAFARFNLILSRLREHEDVIEYARSKIPDGYGKFPHDTILGKLDDLIEEHETMLEEKEEAGNTTITTDTTAATEQIP